MAQFVASFSPGDTVPDWLITVEPIGPDSARPTLTFLRAIHVVEVGGAYHVVPENALEGGDYFMAADGWGIRVFAPDKAVLFPQGWRAINPVPTSIGPDPAAPFGA